MLLRVSQATENYYALFLFQSPVPSLETRILTVTELGSAVCPQASFLDHCTLSSRFRNVPVPLLHLASQPCDLLSVDRS